VERSALIELHSIQHVANLESIRDRGILCHRTAQGLSAARSVANPSVQAIRETKPVLGGRTVHDYACAFFDARTPMMYAIRERHAELVVLRLRVDVLDLDGVVVADGNASKMGTRFGDPETMLPRLDRNLVFARYWTDPDPSVQSNNGRIRSAEVLVPGFIPPEHIAGCYVSCARTRDQVENVGWPDTVRIKGDLFFR